MQRVALLPFENLSGDPALDWMSAAIPKVVAAELAGSQRSVPLVVSNLSEALAGGATRYVHAYFDRRPGLHFEIIIEDASTHKAVRTLSVEGAVEGNPLTTADILAQAVDPTAKPFSTSNAASIQAWAKGDYERALALDRDFGAAWLDWAQSTALVKHDVPEALALVERALARDTLRAPMERARLRMLSANLTNNSVARREALTELSRLAPGDSSLISAAADSEMLARNFSEAARLYGQILKADPNNPAVLNSLGYAYAFAGDVANARKTFADYARFRGQEANAFDSMGEALFVNGQFAEAEKQFLEAHSNNPKMLSGGDLAKAAYAHWLAGDLPGADRIFAQFVQFRTQSGDPTTIWREAAWLRTTGRSAQGEAKLAKPQAPLPPQVAELAAKQIQVWKDPEFPTDPDRLRQVYESTPPAADGLIRTLYAAALEGAGKPEEARKLLILWPLPEQPGDPLRQSLIYPLFQALKGKLR